MLDFHKSNGADATIAVLNVPIEEASRFGIMNTDEDNRIIEFEEKPEHPKSTNASMGIYIFGREVLAKYLEKDEKNRKSSNDFGKNVIPAMLADGKKMYAYHFNGYWKDVGTINSLWEANMDLLGSSPAFTFHDKSWRIYSRNYYDPPQFVGDCARVTNSLITEGCYVNGVVENSILSSGVTVEKGAYIRDSVIMSGVTVKKGALVNYSIVDSDAVIGEGAILGRTRSENTGISVVSAGTVIPDGADIADGEMVSDAYFAEKEVK